MNNVKGNGNWWEPIKHSFFLKFYIPNIQPRGKLDQLENKKIVLILGEKLMEYTRD